MDSGRRMLRQYCQRNIDQRLGFGVTREPLTSSFSTPDRISNSSHTIGPLLRGSISWSSSRIGVSGLGWGDTSYDVDENTSTVAQLDYLVW